MPSSAADRANSAVSCPPDSELAGLLTSELPGDEASELSQHVQQCSACQTRLTRLDPSTLRAQAAERPPDGAAYVLRGAEEVASDRTTTLLPLGPRVPQRIGHYELEQRIGRGGMGIVYRARHTRLGRTVAVKLLPGLQLSDRTAIVRLQREMTATAKVEHENIVAALDAGEHEGIDYLVTEYVEGLDLGRLITACGPLAIADACEIIRQAALGLAHIESRGLVHRDIKPSNLMLSTDGVVKILDLGLARLLEGNFDDVEATHSGFLLGTADYIAPEQIDNPRVADSRSDLYSLGCTFFKLLTGQAPFAGDGLSVVSRKLDAHRSDQIPPLESLRSDGSPELVAILSRFLAKEPGQRWQHAEEVADALAPLSAGADLRRLVEQASTSADLPQPAQGSPFGRSPVTRESTGRQRSTRPLTTSRPRPMAAAIWAVVALGVFASLGGGAWYGALRAGMFGPPEAQGEEDSGSLVSPSLGPGSPSYPDLRQPFTEEIWPGHMPSTVKPAYDESTRLLEVRSDSYRFLRLGEHDGTPARFEVTIRQAPWYGYAGLYFGYRNEPRFGKHQLATYHLFALTQVPQFDPDGNWLRNELSIRRSRTVIDVDPVEERTEELIGVAFEHPQAQQVRLTIEFGRDKCVAVLVNDEPLSLLASDEVNGRFEPADYRGPWGLYHAGHPVRLAPTWFGDVVVTPLE